MFETTMKKLGTLTVVNERQQEQEYGLLALLDRIKTITRCGLGVSPAKMAEPIKMPTGG